MKRPLITLMAAGAMALLLTGCGDVVQVAQTQADAKRITAEAVQAEAEAQRLAAETTRAQAEAQRESVQALIDSQNGRIEDYRLLLTLAFILAAGAMGLSLAMALVMRSTNRQPPQVIYQVMPPIAPTPAAPHAQIGTPAFMQFVQERERRRALQGRNDQRYTI